MRFWQSNLVVIVIVWQPGLRFLIALRIEQKLLNNFGPEDKDLFTKYIDAQAEASQHTAVENLTHGYKMGLVMAAEAFTGMNNLYIGGQEL